MNSIAKFIGSHFKNPQGNFGKLICKVQNIVNKNLYTRLVSLLNLEKGAMLLDIGYGNGYFLELLYKKCPVQMYGIDISESARAMAIGRNKKAHKNDHLHLYIGDCCDLAFPCEAFDAVTTINTIYFWEDTAKGLSEIHRVLKPGASFYNVCYTRAYLDTLAITRSYYRKLETEVLVELCEEAGFSEVKVIEIEKDKSMVIVCTK